MNISHLEPKPTLIPTPLLIESRNIPKEEELNLSLSTIQRKATTKKKKNKCKSKAEYIYIKKSNKKTERKRIKKEKYYFFDSDGDLIEKKFKQNNLVIKGRGMFGKVYYDKTRGSSTKVIKFNNKKNLKYDKEKISYLLKKTTELSSEYIVKFIRIGYLECTYELNLYIEMENIEGIELINFIDKKNFISPLLALKKICEGLYHLQESYKFIHNDLKSSNIMISFRDIYDFSIKIIDIDGGHTIDDYIKYNIDEKIFGTPLYFSPEKLLNLSDSFKRDFCDVFKSNKSFKSLTHIEKKEYIKKQDIYSLGVILFEIIYRRNLHTLIGTFLKFPGNVKQYSLVNTIGNGYDAFVINYPKYDLKKNNKILPTVLEAELKSLSELLKILLRFYERLTLTEIKKFIDQNEVHLVGGNKKSKSTTHTSITSSLASTPRSSFTPGLISMPSQISKPRTFSKTSEISKSENGIFFVKVSEKSDAIEIEPSLFKSKQFNKIDINYI